jgi:hypothetical protein
VTKSDKKTYSDVSLDDKLIEEHKVASLFEEAVAYLFQKKDDDQPKREAMFYCYFVKTDDSENKLNEIEEKKISKERLIQTKKRIDDLK